MMGICIVVVVADVVLWHIEFLFADDASDGEFSWWNFFLSQIWNSITGGFVTAILSYSALATLSGSQTFVKDLARGVSFAVGVTVVFVIVVEPPTICATLLGAMDPGYGGILVPLLAVVLVSYVLNVLWFAAAPAIIAEGLGPLAALKRSAALTAGQRWPLFGLIVLVSVLFWGLQWAVVLLGDALSDQVGHTRPYFIYWIATYVVPAVGLVFWAVVQTSAYYSLRTAKEGAVTAELARVFD